MNKALKMKLDSFKSNGYVVLDDFLPKESLRSLQSLWRKQSNWEKIDQIREEHYSHVFQSNNPFLPSHDGSENGGDVYLAKFERSRELEINSLVNKIYKDDFIPTLEIFSGITLTKFDIRCYQMCRDDHYRIHTDTYAGDIGVVFFLHENSDKDNDN